METPLLASHQDNEDPSLSSFWPADDSGPSQFSRLLEQRAPSLALHWRSITHRPIIIDNAEEAEEESREEWNAGSWLLVGSGTASLLHFGFMWGAYMSTNWSTTFLSIQTPFVTTSFPLLSTNLADLLHQFQNTIVLWISALIIPCLFMVAAPSLILRDSQQPRNWNWKHNYCTSPRSVVECSTRWALFVFYFLVVLQLAVDSTHLNWTGSSVTLKSQAQGGLVAYVAGVASALLALVFLRWPPCHFRSRIVHQSIEHAQQEQFRNRTVEETPTMMVLEDTSRFDGPANSFQPVIRDESEPSVHTTWHCALFHRTKSLFRSFFCKTVMVYQLGLFSFVLWIPAYSLPLLQWSSPRLSSHHYQLVLFELPKLLGQSGAAAGTAVWIIGLLGVVLMTTLFVVPTIALFLAIAIWCLEKKHSRQCQSWLYALHPIMGQAVWCMALLFVTPALEPWSHRLLANNLNVCQAVDAWVESKDCFLLQATFQPGMLLLVLQTISLEFFVVLTLRWSV